MNEIRNALNSLSIGQPTTHRNLAVFPLFAREARDADYLTLDEALAQRACRVTEVSGSGSVPELKFKNRSKHRILLLDGEELVGAKQNRVLNITILVGAGQKIVIPVTCVEQGRWSRKHRPFASAKRAMYARGRREKMAQVSESLRYTKCRRADQGAIWASVAGKAANFDVQSPTGAMADVYAGAETLLDEHRQQFSARAGQNGAVFALDGQVAGLELFDAPETFGKLFPKLLDSYAMDALESRVTEEVAAPTEEQVAGFLSRVTEAKVEPFEALAEGTDLRLDGDRIVGGALEADGWVVHLSAFDEPASGSRQKSESRNSWRSRIGSLAIRRRNRRNM